MMSNLNIDTHELHYTKYSWTISKHKFREADSCLEIEEIYLNDDLSRILNYTRVWYFTTSYELSLREVIFLNHSLKDYHVCVTIVIRE